MNEVILANLVLFRLINSQKNEPICGTQLNFVHLSRGPTLHTTVIYFSYQL